jgi:hypothetical protein
MPETETPDRRREFARDYARFLCAAHDSFGRAAVSLPRPWDFKGRRSSKKPWRPVLDAALRLSPRPNGQILEFGVFRGDSIRHMAARKPASALHGFDSFEGFPDDDRRDWDQDFRVEALPEVPGNVTLHRGFFDATLPAFLDAWTAEAPPIALVHIDCDIFSSTHTVLTALEPYLAAGDIVAFDELMNYSEFAANEFLALYLFLRRTGLDFEWAVTWGRAYPLRESEGRMLDADFIGYRTAGYFQNQTIRLCARKPVGDPTGHFNGPPAPEPLVERLAESLADHAEAG